MPGERDNGCVPDKAAKLNAGKRKYSLIIPELIGLLIPDADNTYHRAMRATLETLAKLAHATDKLEFTSYLLESVATAKKVSELSGWSSLDLVTMAMEYGAAKPEYGRNNWKKGHVWSECVDAAQRHVVAMLRGEEIDTDSGNPHLAHVFGSLHMLMGHFLNDKGVNDIY
jgi:hypothetical protein